VYDIDMNTAIIERITWAKHLLANVHNAAVATVNSDGSPHNTPLFIMHDASLSYLYWSSSPASLHSLNAERSQQVFVVLYDTSAGGGLYIKADKIQQLAGKDLDEALVIQNGLRQRFGRKPLSADCYTNNSPQRMYRAQTINWYVNAAERDNNGKIRRDYRHEIRPSDLID
jgi:hypothetical protein